MYSDNMEHEVITFQAKVIHHSLCQTTKIGPQREHVGTTSCYYLHLVPEPAFLLVHHLLVMRTCMRTRVYTHLCFVFLFSLTAVSMILLLSTIDCFLNVRKKLLTLQINHRNLIKRQGFSRFSSLYTQELRNASIINIMPCPPTVETTFSDEFRMSI